MRVIEVVGAAFFAVAAVATETPGSGTFALFYERPESWATSYLHYNAGQGWNDIPGAQMGVSTNASYPAPSWQYVEVPGNSVTWVMTDGNGNWVSCIAPRMSCELGSKLTLVLREGVLILLLCCLYAVLAVLTVPIFPSFCRTTTAVRTTKSSTPVSTR
jgi:hypothetical protein